MNATTAALQAATAAIVHVPTCQAEMGPGVLPNTFDVRCDRHGFDVRGYRHGHALAAKASHERQHTHQHEVPQTIQASPMLALTGRASRSVALVLDASDMFPLARILAGEADASDVERLREVVDAIQASLA